MITIYIGTVCAKKKFNQSSPNFCLVRHKRWRIFAFAADAVFFKMSTFHLSRLDKLTESGSPREEQPLIPKSYLIQVLYIYTKVFLNKKDFMEQQQHCFSDSTPRAVSDG